VKKIPFVKPDLTISDNIAIVGSSGILRGSECGNIIDSHNDVIRFNRAPTANFEKDVGAKTTLRVINNHVFNNNDILHEGYSDQPKDFVRNLRDTKILYFASDLDPWRRRDTNTHTSNELFLYEYGATEAIKSHFGFPKEKYPTLGVGFICLCVLLDIVPSLYGFDTTNRSRDHYYERSRPDASSYHGVSFEKQFISELSNQGRVKLN